MFNNPSGRSAKPDHEEILTVVSVFIIFEAELKLYGISTG
jgi:hypothetical protein